MATKDRTSLKNDFANGKYATGEKFADLIDSMKVVQLPVVDPQALGTSLSFIDSISQDEDGKITATKKTLDLSNAHELNPFKGWYKTGDTLPTDGFDGAYLYFKDTTQSPVVTTIYQWNGTAYVDTETEVDESNVQTFGSGQAVNAVKIMDEAGEEVSGPASLLTASAGNSLIINVSRDYGSGIPSGSYPQCDNASGDYFAPSLVPSGRRVVGAVITFEYASKKWKTYQFQGAVAEWSNANRWVQIGNFVTWQTVHRTLVNTYDVTLVSDFQLVDGITEVYLRVTGIPFYLAQHLKKIGIAGVNYDVVNTIGNELTSQSMVRSDKYYHFLYKNNKFWLQNEDDFEKDYPLILGKDYNFKEHGDLVVGYISTTGQDGDISTRMRTDRYYQTPLKITTNSGFYIHAIVQYDANGFSTYEGHASDNLSEKTIAADNYYYRLVFRKSNSSATFDGTEDVGQIVVDDGTTADTTEIITLNNVENMVAVGTSHTEGNGSVKGKSFMSYISALYDWNVVNLGRSGMSYIQAINNYLNNTQLETGAKFSDINKSGICLDFLGGGAENVYYALDAKYTVMNIKRFYSIMRSMGYEVIAGSYFGDHVESIGEIQNVVAKELGLQTLKNVAEGARLNMIYNGSGSNGYGFPYYWWNNHFATRTVAIQFYPFWQTAKIRRPRTAIKIYRSRGLETSNDDLLYNNVFERIKWWREIEVNHRALQDDSYVDLLWQTLPTLTPVASEYTALKHANGTVTIADKVLIEFVLPAVAGGLTNLKLHIACSGSGTRTCYLRKYVDSSLAIALTSGNLRFVLDDVTGISINDTFTCNTGDSGYDWSNITFTVKSVDTDTNVVIAEPSSTISTAMGATSTATITINGNTINATNITKGTPNAYTDEYALGGIGKWESATMDSDGFITIANPEKYMAFDKVSLMIVGSAEFTVGNIYASLNVIAEKPQSFYEPRSDDFLKGCWKNILTDKFNGTTTPTSALAGATVNVTNGGYGWNGQLTGKTGLQIPRHYGYVKEAQIILHLKEGDSVVYTLPELVHNVDIPTRHFRLRVVARYYPAFNGDSNAESFTVTQNTFDFARLGIKTGIGTTYKFTNIVYVPASYVEINQDLYVDANSTSDLTLEALDDDLEILYVQMWEDVSLLDSQD